MRSEKTCLHCGQVMDEADGVPRCPRDGGWAWRWATAEERLLAFDPCI